MLSQKLVDSYPRNRCHKICKKKLQLETEDLNNI